MSKKVWFKYVYRDLTFSYNILYGMSLLFTACLLTGKIFYPYNKNQVNKLNIEDLAQHGRRCIIKIPFKFELFKFKSSFLLLVSNVNVVVFFQQEIITSMPQKQCLEMYVFSSLKNPSKP